MNTNTANRLATNLTFERSPDGVFRLVAMFFQLRPTTTGASLRWHRDVSWVCGTCTATLGASRRRKTQVPARVLARAL